MFWKKITHIKTIYSLVTWTQQNNNPHNLRAYPGPVDSISRPYYCGRCQKVVYSRVELIPGCGVYGCAAFLCCIGFWPCAWIPCFINDLYDIYHHCSICGCIMVENKKC